MKFPFLVKFSEAKFDLKPYRSFNSIWKIEPHVVSVRCVTSEMRNDCMLCMQEIASRRLELSSKSSSTFYCCQWPKWVRVFTGGQKIT